MDYRKMPSVLLLFSLCVLGVDYTSAEFGLCPIMNVQKNFDLPNFLGTWYQVGAYNTEVFGDDLRCFEVEYYSQDGIIHFIHSGLDKYNMKVSKKGTLTFAEDAAINHEGKLVISHGKEDSGHPFWVLYTDYNRFAIIYTCKPEKIMFHQFAVWVLYRHDLNVDFRDEARKILEEHGISTTGFKKMDRKHCHKAMLR